MRTKQGSYPADAPAQAARLKEDAPKPAARPSSLVDTLVIYCGDNLEQLKKLPDACVDLIYIDPPFNSAQDYNAFFHEKDGTKAALAKQHEQTPLD
jgi:16S rRNA G966 N2-methylase RsmD